MCRPIRIHRLRVGLAHASKSEAHKARSRFLRIRFGLGRHRHELLLNPPKPRRLRRWVQLLHHVGILCGRSSEQVRLFIKLPSQIVDFGRETVYQRLLIGVSRRIGVRLLAIHFVFRLVNSRIHLTFLRMRFISGMDTFLSISASSACRRNRRRLA